MRRTAGLLIGLALSASSALGQTERIYGNNAGGGADIIQAVNRNTGALIQTYTGTDGNGRGVVVIGNTLYYTVVNDPHIYMLDVATGLPTGAILTGQASLSTLAYDGEAFWTADYSGTNQAFRISLTGETLRTISLANASGGTDGLEYFNGKLIANRCDACGTYDIYDLDGNVLQADVISVTGGGTGIAFDGTDFFVSKVFENAIDVFDMAGTFLRTIHLEGSHLFEDLSVDYAQRSDTGGPSVAPEPSTISLFATGLLGLLAPAAARRRRS
jgi:MYXO-CTERM domain-containing protein